MLISFVIITHNRVHELERCIRSLPQDGECDIIVVDNASQDGTCAMVAEKFPQVRLHKSDTNLGVPGGRNLGFQLAKGDICISLDDDAELMTPDCLDRCRAYFTADPALACVSFRIMDATGQRIARKLIPRRDRKVLEGDSEGALFSGTGFAFRRETFLTLGGFWDDLVPYFGEEPDLTYRLLERGYTILHSVHIRVRHYESAVMRPTTRRTYCGVRNTPWIAMRSLPWFAVVTLTLFGWGYFFVVALRGNHVSAYLLGIRDSVSGFAYVVRQRKPISLQTRKKLRQFSGLYWF